MSGYDYNFISAVSEEDNCPICSSPMKEPVQTRCGHRFCRFCLEESMKRMKECPIDRRTLNAEDIFPDRASERKILDYQVMCPNENDGCQWIGELRNVEAHGSNCFFVRVPCTNADCDVTMLRNDLQRHVTEVCPRRIISCQHCQQNYTWCQEEEHFNNCPRFPCNCPQRCGQDNIPRNELNTHQERECGLTEVSCSYAHVGCQVLVPRNALGRHLQFSVETHLKLACEKLEVMQNESIITNEKLEQLETAVTNFTNLGELWNKVTDAVTRIDKLKGSIASTCRLEISKTDEKVELLEAILSANRRKQQERDELFENVRSIVEGLQGDIADVKRRLQELPSAPARTGTEPQGGTTRGVRLPPIPQPATRLSHQSRRIRNSAYERLRDTMEDESANVDEQRQQELPGANQMNAWSPEQHIGIHISNKFIWKFNQFEDALQKAKGGLRAYHLSELFHSCPYGYRMCVELHPNGLNEGWNTHVSIFVCLLRSEYDDILPWPFNQKVTITLIDQQPNSYLKRNVQMSSLPKNNGRLNRCYFKPSESRQRNVAFGFCKFITQKRLKTRRYLVNDSIFICVNVDPLHSIL